jgi:hypothetical protein
MSATFNPDLVRQKLAEASDEELVRVAFVDRGAFIPEVVELANAELKARGIDGEGHPTAIASRQRVLDAKAEALEQLRRPAHPLVIVIAFIFADFFAIGAMVWYGLKGRSQAVIGVLKAFVLGWVARIAVVLWLTFPGVA